MVNELADRKPNGFLPTLLILAGLLIFAANFGWLGWTPLFSVLRLWPLLLIAVGADLLFGGRYRLYIVLAALAAGALLYASGFGLAAGETLSVSQSLEGARNAHVRLQVGVAELRLGQLDDPDGLIEGNVRTGQDERVAQTFRMEGNTAFYALVSEGRTSGLHFGGSGRVWNLALTNRVPVTLNVDTGVGSATLDLADLQLTRLDMNTGVGATTLTLPRQGRYQASLETGVGAATIHIPEGVAARVQVSRGLGTVSMVGDFVRDGDIYTSIDYATAQNRVELRVSGGVGAITVRAGR